MRKWFFGLGFVLGMLLMPAFATEMSGLNVAETAVKDQSDQSLQQILPQSFSEVLIKLSGNPGVVTLPQIQNAIQNPKQYLQSYSFFTRESSPGVTQTYARITFDKKGVVQLLRQAGQAIWTRNRPLILVWIKNGIGESASVVSSGDNDAFTAALTNNAKRRGLPVILPDMDLQDQAFINTDGQKVFDPQKLQAAESRYKVNIILAGDIQLGINNNWQGQWYLIFYGQPFQWDNTAPDSATLISKAIDNTANILANQLATSNNQSLQTPVRIEINGIMNLSDYAKVIKYLKNLSIVSSVNVSNMENNSLILDITTVGGSEKLMSALQGSASLVAIKNPDPQNLNGIELYYQWKGSTGQYS